MTASVEVGYRPTAYEQDIDPQGVIGAFNGYVAELRSPMLPESKAAILNNITSLIVDPTRDSSDIDYIDTEKLDVVLQHVGLHPVATTLTWDHSYENADWVKPEDAKALTEIYLGNIRTISELEAAHQGSVSVLHDEFGLTNFGRYQPHMDSLVRQYERRDDRTRPYGIVLTVDDSNQALGTLKTYKDEMTHESYLPEFEKLGYDVRFVEAATKPQLARVLLNLKRRYGFRSEEDPGHKISFAIGKGHAIEKDFFIMSSDSKPGHLSTDNLSDPAFARYRSLFTDDFTAILDVCVVGRPEGMAEKFAHELGIKTIAATEPITDTYIRPFRRGQGLGFDVSYRDFYIPKDKPPAPNTIVPARSINGRRR
jgi:hypothetical protein